MESFELQPIILHADGKLEHSARVCSVCNCGMLSGYVLWDGDKYACSDKCLYKLEDAEGNLWTLESFSDYAEQRESEDETFGTDCYWTDWYECDKYTCYICEQIYIENKKKGK